MATSERALHGIAVETRSSDSLKGLTIEAVGEDAARYRIVRHSIIGALHASMKTVSWSNVRFPRTREEMAGYFTIFDSPDGWQRRIWDLLIVVLVLILTLLLPFELLVPFFHKETHLKNFVYYFMPTIFWLDVPVNFLGAYYHGTHLVTVRLSNTTRNNGPLRISHNNFGSGAALYVLCGQDQMEIFWHYVWGNPFTENRGWFLVDILGNIPWDAFVAVDGEQKSAKLAKLLKLPKLLRSYSYGYSFS